MEIAFGMKAVFDCGIACSNRWMLLLLLFSGVQRWQAASGEPAVSGDSPWRGEKLNKMKSETFAIRIEVCCCEWRWLYDFLSSFQNTIDKTR